MTRAEEGLGTASVVPADTTVAAIAPRNALNLAVARVVVCSLVLASSELAELRRISDRIAVIDRGRVAGILAPDAPDVEFGLLFAGESRRRTDREHGEPPSRRPS